MKKFVYASVMVSLIVCGAMGQAEQGPAVDRSESGIEVLLDDTWLFPIDGDNDSYWEPCTDIFGDGTIAVTAGVYGEDADGWWPDSFNAKVAFIDNDNNVSEYYAYFADDGTPWTDTINLARTDGNPPQICVDSRVGGTMRYMVGQEATPWEFDEFNSDGRWYQNFVYNKQFSCVQICELGADGPVPITNMFDCIYMKAGIEGDQGGEQVRFGGTIQGLSNGHFVTVPEDRSGILGGRTPSTNIYDLDGNLVAGPFNGRGDDTYGDIWSNVAAFDGGFVIRSNGHFAVWSNAGELQYMFEQAEMSIIEDTGRGDGYRIKSDIRQNMVYLAGKTSEDLMCISGFDAAASSQGNIVAMEDVILNNEEYWDVSVFNRTDCSADAAGNVVCCWDETFASENPQVVCVILDSDMNPVTPIFFAFGASDDINAAEFLGCLTKENNVSMDEQRVCVAANGIMPNPAGGMTGAEQTFVTVYKNPLAPEPVVEWALY